MPIGSMRTHPIERAAGLLAKTLFTGSGIWRYPPYLARSIPDFAVMASTSSLTVMGHAPSRQLWHGPLSISLSHKSTHLLHGDLHRPRSCRHGLRKGGRCAVTAPSDAYIMQKMRRCHPARRDCASCDTPPCCFSLSWLANITLGRRWGFWRFTLTIFFCVSPAFPLPCHWRRDRLKSVLTFSLVG